MKQGIRERYLCYISYYIMPKKRGRKKKRGPKKKKPQVIYKYRGLKRPYHIITSVNNKQIKDIYTAVDISTALNKLKELQTTLNKDVTFPVRFISNNKIKKFIEADYKLILIRKDESIDTYKGQMKNEFGKYVDVETDSTHWTFIESLPYQVEETFWVYGYNPKCQRKTFPFICSEFIDYTSKSKYFFKEVGVYKNKLLINSLDGLNMIICKNHQDSVRLYNAIADYTKEKKLKSITFIGDIKPGSYSFLVWQTKIQELTNWTIKKINQNTTRD